MKKSFLFFIQGSFKPLAIDTEKASIARPTPNRTELKKNINSGFIIPPDKNKSMAYAILKNCTNIVTNV